MCVETAEGRTGPQTDTLSPATVHLQGNTVVTLCVCVIVCEFAYSGKNYDFYEVG